MNKLPSERIKEIKGEILAHFPSMNKVSNFELIAVIKYLDEEHEKKNGMYNVIDNPVSPTEPTE